VKQFLGKRIPIATSGTFTQPFGTFVATIRTKKGGLAFAHLARFTGLPDVGGKNRPAKGILRSKRRILSLAGHSGQENNPLLSRHKPFKING
jgi:hypothetical protein